MPKKTKKEKIIAELRRKLKSVEIGSWKLDTEDRETDILKKELFTPIPKTQNIQPQNLSSSFNLPSSYVINDLRKTFLLAGLAISFELVVYLVWR